MDVAAAVIRAIAASGHPAAATRPDGSGTAVLVEDTRPLGVATVSHLVRVEVYRASSVNCEKDAEHIIGVLSRVPQIGWWGIDKPPSPAPSSDSGMACYDFVVEFIE